MAICFAVDLVGVVVANVVVYLNCNDADCADMEVGVMFPQTTLIAAAVAFVLGTIIGATVQNWRGDAQNAEDRETYQKQVVAAQNLQIQALKRSAEKSTILSSFFGETDDETARIIADLRARNAELVRLRDRRTAADERASCLPATTDPADLNSTAPGATGVPADLPGLLPAAQEQELTGIYAYEASVLRVKLNACIRMYGQAQAIIQKQ